MKIGFGDGVGHKSLKLLLDNDDFEVAFVY